MATTLRDIARRAGVSVTTASRIINGSPTGLPIRDETRAKVLSIAQELAYKPNFLARALRGSRSSLLGVIVRDISEPFFTQVLVGVQRAAIARQYRVFLGDVERQASTTIDYGSMFEQSHADGILIVGDMEDDDLTEQWLLSKHRHIVGVTDRSNRRLIPGVYSDSESGARIALEHLWALGHRQILCVSDPGINDGRIRAATYQQFMREHGVDEAQIRVMMIFRSSEEAFQAGQVIFAAADRPTAIFAVNDAIAIGLMQAAYQFGIAVPEQISIIGYDDIDVARYIVPPLTTINQSGVEMGYTATNLLLDMIEQEADTSQVDDVILKPTLVIRQSTTKNS